MAAHVAGEQGILAAAAGGAAAQDRSKWDREISRLCRAALELAALSNSGAAEFVAAAAKQRLLLEGQHPMLDLFLTAMISIPVISQVPSWTTDNSRAIHPLSCEVPTFPHWGARL